MAETLLGQLGMSRVYFVPDESNTLNRQGGLGCVAKALELCQ